MKSSMCFALLCRNVSCYLIMVNCSRACGRKWVHWDSRFLLIRVPADCLCPHTNRISHASFPMVFCPVLASWWMENRTEERVCNDVCLAWVRQQSQLQPQSSICPGHRIHHLGYGQAEKRSIHNLGTSDTVKLKYYGCILAFSCGNRHFCVCILQK